MTRIVINTKSPYDTERVVEPATTLDDDIGELTLTQFERILSLHEDSGDGFIHFIGGDPSNNKMFKELLLKASESSTISDIKLTLPGTHDKRTNELIFLLTKKQNVSVDIHWVSPDEVSESTHKKIFNNASIISSMGRVKLSLRTRFHDPDRVHKSVIEAADKLNASTIKYDIHPTTPDEIDDAKSYLKALNETVFRFNLEARDKNISVTPSTSHYPVCMYGSKQLRELAILNSDFRSEVKIPDTVILPTMEAIYDFDHTQPRISISDVDCIDDVKTRIIDTVESELKSGIAMQKCENCRLYTKHGRSCVSAGLIS